MSAAFHRVMALACAVLLLLLSIHAPSPVSANYVDWSQDGDIDEMAADRAVYFSVMQALINRLRRVRNKRTRADGGFFSRHDAMSDYLRSAYASRMANDLYGPGKRK